MVERLWEDSPAVGPLPELMSEIMASIPKPVLTLDCPTEEVILKISRIPDFIFAKGGVVYGVSHFESSITLQQISPPEETTTLVSGTIFSSTPASGGKALFYYAADTKHLYILYAVKSPSLAANVNCSRRLPELTSGGMRPNHMVVMEDEIFVAGSIEVIVVWPATAAVNGGKILHLNPGSVKPLCLNIVLVDNSITYLVPLERVREAAPVVFKAKARRPLMNLPTRLAESLIVGSNTFRVRRPDGQYALVGVHPGLVSDNFSLWSSSLLTCPSHAASDLAGNIYLVFDRCPGQQSSIFGHQLQQQASDDPPENRLAFYHRPRRTSGGPPESRQGSHNRRQSAFHTWVREASGNSPETRQGSNERGQSTFNSWRGETSSGSPATGSLFSGGPLQASASTLECRAIPDYRLLRASPYLHL
ncbi:hypothetical protein FOZ63_024150 [Perkinsus olseni]|uniref:Uncharacterized protein n=1 Tax=Perkinsus olseni TaxID=32597 RepID=A0A7J6QRU3_PEROL|nr:hypothetical protein FOZ63_024150 [Perkinsus olseni]